MNSRSMRRVGLWLALALMWAGMLGASPIDRANSAHVPGASPFSLPEEAGSPRFNLLRSDSQSIDIHVDLSGWSASQVDAAGSQYTRLSGEAYAWPEQAGQPALPALIRLVEIPMGADVRIEILENQTEEYLLNQLGWQPLYPLQPPLSKESAPGEMPPFIVDREFYSHAGWTPTASVTLGEAFTLRGRRFQPVEIWPVSYSPSGSSVRFTRWISFRLDWTYRLESSGRTSRSSSTAWSGWIDRQIVNPPPRPVLASSQPDLYLIIAADAFLPALQPFIQLQEQRGFQVVLAPLSQISAGSVREEIKAYLQQAYDSWPKPPDWVLFVGDTDTIPAWDSTQSSGSYTDLYYFTMDGPDDWMPDIAHGRFPVRTPDQAAALVSKYLSYYSLTGAEAWLKRITFISTCDQYSLVEATHQYAIDRYTRPYGYSGYFPWIGIPGGDRIYCHTYSGSSLNIQTALNEGRTMVVYSGHGTRTGWLDGQLAFGQTGISSLASNSIYPLVASFACQTADFHFPESFGETWLIQPERGALVFWGSSQITFWNPDDRLERTMFEALFQADGSEPDIYGMTASALLQV